ncbi:hypothetical protein LOTGIDRAFT_174390 [Lottia gigantea]|uniref:Hexosyltransferase n=1 Tax=Lottia gigantea TaxID=225164 RepID=V4A2L4_LOTGI|nr:hypothetical protein LOTGIDRAFT_174390 [Lottia gigantea]ESO98108.1 hypothetical protein LOTGIDRAFT_174390 [Lottia gigantea]
MCLKTRNLLQRKIKTLFLLLLCFYTGFYTTTYFRFVRFEEECNIRNLFAQGGKFHKSSDPLLLVSVMTTRKNLDKHAAAIYSTWGKRFPGNIIFFVGGSEPPNSDLPVINLRSVNDNVFPPQVKVFAMIKYVAKHFLNDFEWFMRADDDLFLKPEKIEHFLRTINSSKTLYMGSPGFGKSSELGHLGLFENSAFCMGGPGVIFSRSALEKLKDKITTCISNTKTLHEDTELGRCVQYYVGIGCSSSYEMVKLFLHNYDDSKGSFTKKLGSLEDRAITLHPVKQSPHQYRITIHYDSLKITELRNKLARLRLEITDMSGVLNGRATGIKHEGRDITLEKFSEINSLIKSDEDIASYDSSSKENWDTFINDVGYSSFRYQNPVGEILPYQNHSKSSARSLIKNLQESTSAFVDIFYRRLIYGEYLEHVFLERLQHKSYRAYRTLQTFHDIEFREVANELLPSREVWIVLPVFKQSEVFNSFLSTVSEVVEQLQWKVHLEIILYHDDDNEYKKSKEYLYARNEFHFHFRIIFVYDSSTRNSALSSALDGASGTSLLIFLTIHSHFDENFLLSVSKNTKLKQQVYFPIRFSRFHSDTACFGKTICDIEADQFGAEIGFWREFGVGIFSIYKSDLEYLQSLKRDKLDLYDLCVQSNLTVFRSVDPSLIESHHHQLCDLNTGQEQYQSCMTVKHELFGHELSLIKLIHKLKIKY